MKRLKLAAVSPLAAFILIAMPACGQSTDEVEAQTAPVETVIAPEETPRSFPAGFDAADTENWRAVDPENLFVFETSKGTVYVEAFPEVAPNHVAQYRKIIRSGDYDGTVFHRVIDGFMAQGGDILAAKGRPSGEPNLQAEFTFQRDPYEWEISPIGQYESARYGFWKGAPIATQSAFLAEMNETGTVESYIPHCPGIMSTARTDDPNSANSQFFWMRGTNAGLDRQYTAWGRILDSQGVVLSIKAGPRERNGTVDNPDVLIRARVAADMPEAERPVAYSQRTDGPRFTSQLATIDHSVNICDLEAVPSVVID